jgi:ribonuclease D
MNKAAVTNHHYINTQEALSDFYEKNKNVSWIGFDTEFVGERTYVPVLCLVQVASEHGNYLIDVLALDQVDLFLKLIIDPKILKITHAGENDYRLLFQQYNVLPIHVFDTQIAAGFIGYNYPVSFQNLLQGELKVRLDKGSAVSDWVSRPISKKQLQYALNDVIYLERLWKKMSGKLHARKRETWVDEEFEKLQSEKSYSVDKNKEFLANSMLGKINLTEKLFLLRLYRWRIETAATKNQPKERILQKKYISHIVKAVKGGKNELLQNRLIPEHIVHKHHKVFTELYTLPITKEEQSVLDSISKNVPVKPRIDAVMDILYLGIKIICSEQKVAPELVVNRANFKRMKWDLDYFDESLNSNWRKELLGNIVINSIQNRTKLKVDTKGEFFALKIIG